MPQINILNVLQGDSQSTVVDKINYNFDQILSAGGGPQGAQGLIGPTGPIGPQGPQGVQGVQGPSGTKWFVQDSSPASGGITGANPWTFPTLGDYWLDPDSANQDVYVFGTTGWLNTGFGLASGQLFQKVTPIDVIGGATGQAILLSGATAGDKSLVLSDSSINDYTPGGSAIQNLNFEDAKLKVATKDSRAIIMSFGRSTFDVLPAGTGSSTSTYNPHFSWDLQVNPFGTTGVGPNFYNLSFVNPKGAIGIKSSGTNPAECGVNLLSTSEITSVADDNILLKTTAAAKGTFIESSFLELSNGYPSNSSFAPIFANSTGFGLGLGTGQFEQSSTTGSRRLAVNGNASIGTGASPHTAALFVGESGTPNYNQGVLFVAGHSMIGHNNPTGDNSGGIQTTGPSELAGRYPQLFVTSPNYGPGLQIKTKGVNYSPRTIIGDGIFDGSGTGPSITQEIFGGTGYNFGSFNQPLITYTHKISNVSNSGASGPVFSITTFTNGGTYSYSSAAHRTLIETKNSNKKLEIMANGTGGQNSITMGVINSSLLSIYGASGSTSGGVSIGINSNISPTLGALTGSTFNYNNKANHSLYVTGIQTIGSNDPVSLFNRSTTGTSKSFGGNSLLKVSRDLYSSTSPSGKGSDAAGFSVNNYPNGLEISSYLPASPLTGPSANDSVAIAVGATTYLNGGTTGTAAATGFFVSNDGRNIAIGTPLDYTAAIGVSGAGSDFAIKAKGNAGITGNVGITGDTTLAGDLSITSGGEFNYYGTSPSTSDIRITTSGRIFNPTNSLHHNTTTDPPGGVVYVGPGDEVISSGVFSYSSSGTVTGTWMKVGQVIHVAGRWSRTGSDQFYLPVQPQAGSSIGTLFGVCYLAISQPNTCYGVRAIATPGPPPTFNAQIYNDGSGLPANDDYYFTLQYVIA